jgi:hypothetical protein
MFRLADHLIQLAKRFGDPCSQHLIPAASIAVIGGHRPALDRPLDAQQGALDAIHGFFEGLIAHG